MGPANDVALVRIWAEHTGGFAAMSSTARNGGTVLCQS